MDSDPTLLERPAGGRDRGSYAERYRRGVARATCRTVRGGGFLGLRMIEAEQTAFDLTGPPVAEMTFVQILRGAWRTLLDVGDGVRDLAPRPGDVLCYPAGAGQRTAVADDHAVRTLTLPAARVADVLDGAGLDGGALNPHWGRCLRDPRAAKAMAGMADALSGEALSGESGAAGLMLDGLVLQFLAVVAAGKGLSPFADARPEDARIARVIDHVDAHLADPLTLTALAEVACLSPSQFARVFKVTTGVPVWGFVQRRRAERARDLVRGADMPLARVAPACGFANQAHMTTVLRRTLGTTPGRLRREG